MKQDIYELFYYPGHASLAPHILLNELEVSYKLTLVDIKDNAQHSEEYATINPQRKIPTIRYQSTTLSESAAICLWLAFDHKFLTTSNTKQLQWLFFLSNTLQPALMDYHYPETRPGSVNDVSRFAKHQISTHLQWISAQLKGAETLESDFSVSDIYLFMLVYWCRNFLDEISGIENLVNAHAQIRLRPAIEATIKKEGLNY